MTIREFTPDDGEVFWQLRLNALRTNPEAFAMSYETELTKPLSEVQGRLQTIYDSPDDFILGAWAETGQVVGMMGLHRFTQPKLQHKAEVWGVFVLPEWRGRGLAGQMLDILLSRSRELPGLEQLQLGVATEQKTAVHLYQSRGFQTYGLEKQALRVGDEFVNEYDMVLFLQETASTIVDHHE